MKREWFNDEWCKDSRATCQTELQKTVFQIRAFCSVDRFYDMGDYVCTIYKNKSVGVTYWVKDAFGKIEEITEVRE